MTAHEHAYGALAERGTVGWCRAGDGCRHMRVVDHRTGQWRDLTGPELLNVTAHMLEADAIGRAMTMIHGREHGQARARQVLGYER